VKSIYYFPVFRWLSSRSRKCCT